MNRVERLITARDVQEGMRLVHDNEARSIGVTAVDRGADAVTVTFECGTQRTYRHDEGLYEVIA